MITIVVFPIMAVCPYLKLICRIWATIGLSGEIEKNDIRGSRLRGITPGFRLWPSPIKGCSEPIEWHT